MALSGTRMNGVYHKMSGHLEDKTVYTRTRTRTQADMCTEFVTTSVTLSIIILDRSTK